MYDQKIQSSREAVESHNSNVSEKIKFEDFLDKLQKLGGTSEEALATCSFEDLESCGLPRILAKMISKKFRKKDESGSNKSSYVSAKKAEAMTSQELVERYNPRDVKNAVGQRLKGLSNGKRCIVFNIDGTVNVEESVKMLNALSDGYDELDTVTCAGSVLQVYKVGDKLDFFADIDPINNKPLRPDGTCQMTGRSWGKVSQKVRQMINIAHRVTQELKIDNIDDIHDIIDIAEKDGAEQHFRLRYRKASLRFDEMEKMGGLPVLKVRLGSSRSIDRKENNPFYAAHKTF